MIEVSSKTMLALLAALIALVGAQALAPGLASAMVQMGEECADPTYPSVECETTGGGGGGGGSQGGGASDGSNAGEVIEVHDTPPSPCAVSPSSCLPRETGGGPRGVQADRGPYQPRRGGRPVRVAKVPKGRTQLTCSEASKRLETLESIAEQLAVAFIVAKHLQVNEKRRINWLRSDLAALKAMRGSVPADSLRSHEKEIELISSELRIHQAALDAANLQLASIDSRVASWAKDWTHLLSGINGSGLLTKCDPLLNRDLRPDRDPRP